MAAARGRLSPFIGNAQWPLRRYQVSDDIGNHRSAAVARYYRTASLSSEHFGHPPARARFHFAAMTYLSSGVFGDVSGGYKVKISVSIFRTRAPRPSRATARA
jgi:hypothetical protein